MSSKYLKNYNSEEYKDYLEQLKKYKEYKLLILNSRSKKTTDYFKEDGNSYILKYKKININLTKPEYKNIFEEIKILKNQKKELRNNYNYYRYSIIHEIAKENDYDKYDKIVKKLKELDNEINSLIEYYITVNIQTKNNIETNKKKIEETTKIKKNLYEKIKSETDDIRMKEYIKEYLELYNCNISNTQNYYNIIEFIIVKKPKINDSVEIDKKVNEKKKLEKKCKKTINEIVEENEIKLKDKIKKKLKNTPKDKLDNLEKATKDKLFKDFKFKNEKECSSKSSTKEYYMKKTDIIKIIKKYKKVRKMLPEDFDKLSKKDLCKELFKI